MRSLSRVLALLAVLAIVISNLPAQENDKAKGEKKENLTRLPNITGKLVNPGSDKGKIVLSVPIQVPESNGRRGIRVREQHKDVNLTPDDDMIVRKAEPPIFYDNGKPRKATSKELKEAKGEGNLPGYQADLSDLKKGQIVTCYYAVKKPAKKGDPDAKPDDGAPRVRLIVIMKEP